MASTVYGFYSAFESLTFKIALSNQSSKLLLCSIKWKNLTGILYLDQFALLHYVNSFVTKSQLMYSIWIFNTYKLLFSVQTSINKFPFFPLLILLTISQTVRSKKIQILRKATDEIRWGFWIKLTNSSVSFLKFRNYIIIKILCMSLWLLSRIQRRF